jgi:hypothetical protein
VKEEQKLNGTCPKKFFGSHVNHENIRTDLKNRKPVLQTLEHYITTCPNIPKN